MYWVWGYGNIRYSGIPVTSCFTSSIVSEPTLLFVITLLPGLGDICANSIGHGQKKNDMQNATRVRLWTPAMEYCLRWHPEGGRPIGDMYHLLRQQYSGGYGRGWYSLARTEGKYRPWGYDLLNRVSQIEPNEFKDGSGAVYMLHQFSPSSFRLKEEQIMLCTALKYLGLWFDGKLTFKEHAKRTAAKAKRVIASTSRLMSNLGRLSEGKRKLLANIAMLVLFSDSDFKSIFDFFDKSDL